MAYERIFALWKVQSPHAKFQEIEDERRSPVKSIDDLNGTDGFHSPEERLSLLAPAQGSVPNEEGPFIVAKDSTDTKNPLELLKWNGRSVTVPVLEIAQEEEKGLEN